MKMLTEEQCAKPCPKNMLSWDVGAPRGGIIYSLHSPPSGILTCPGFLFMLTKLGL